MISTPSSSGRLSTLKLKFNQSLPQSVDSKIFLILTILESTVDIILESILIARLNLIHTLSKSNLELDPAKTPLAVYLGIFILAHLFQLYFALDALRHKNTIQLIGLGCFNFALLVYAIMQVPEIKEIEIDEGITKSSLRLTTSSILLVIIPVCIGICQVAFSYLTWHLYKEFGWQIYKQIGADRKIKRMYLMYQIFMCLLKFDYFFFMAFSVQLVLLVPSVSVSEKVLTIIALPATLLLLVVGYYGVRKENPPIMASFMIGLLSGSSYFIYKLFRIWQGRNDPQSYENVFKSLTVFSVSCLLMTLFSFTSAIICLKNFGKGLKVQMDKNKVNHKATTRRRIGVTDHQHFGSDRASLERNYHSHRSSGTNLSISKGTIGSEGLVFELDGKILPSSKDDFDSQIPSHPPPPFVIEDSLNNSHHDHYQHQAHTTGLNANDTNMTTTTNANISSNSTIGASKITSTSIPSSVGPTTATHQPSNHHPRFLSRHHHLLPELDAEDENCKRMSID